MIEADSVHSTPPLSSSSIQKASPPLEARAESSPKPVEAPAVASNVIRFDFSLPRKAARKAHARKSRAAKEKAEAATAPAPSSVTAENGRLRKDRREAWRAAEGATRYWRVRLDLETAVEIAQNHDIREGRLHPEVDRANWMPMVDKYRKALVEQLLTPAWDVASLTWKRTLLARNDYVVGRYVKAERVQRAIEEDLAFLADHPTRRSIRATKKRS
jgi:hypothetical protein